MKTISLLKTQKYSRFYSAKVGRQFFSILANKQSIFKCLTLLALSKSGITEICKSGIISQIWAFVIRKPK